MKNLILIVLCIVGTRSWAQIDQKRMDRDLEVARNILNTLISDNNNNMFLINRDIDAGYLPGYGVTFTLPDNQFFWQLSLQRGGFSVGRGASRAYRYNYSITTPDPDKDSGSRENNVAVYVGPDNKADEQENENGDSGTEETQEEYTAHLKDAIITFFADYADLISQLGPDSRIRVIQKIPPDFPVIAWEMDNRNGSAERQAGFSAEVYKKDITAYKEGKLSLDQFKSKVNFMEADKAARAADLDLFSKIMKSYFSPDVSQTYFVQNTPRYERIKDYGVIYTVQTYSSYQDNDLFRMPATGQNLNLQERNKKAEEMYPEFVKDIKNFIIDYGRTIRSLGDNENLILKVTLTRCEDCSIPKSIEVSVKASVLSQYDQQKISKDKALASINIKRNDQ